MGGGLGFLNKKSWHTGGMRQQEEVWKREQEYAKEQRKLEDLRKQIQEERKREELDEVAMAGGHKQKVERLDWMYAGLMSSKQAADERNEASMNAPAKLEEAADEARVDKVATLPSFYQDDTPKSTLEQWQRLNNDPLFAIKRQEAAARARIKSNPVQMQAIKRELSSLKDAAEGGKKRKKEKKDKKEKKEKRDKADRREREREREGGHSHGHRRRSASPEERRRDAPREPPREAPHFDGASAQRHGGSYGLDAKHVPHGVAGARESGAEATRKRLAEADQRRAEEEREAAAKRARHQRHTAGRLSEEEKARRLREMMSDAGQHEDTRRQKVTQYSREEEEEEQRTRTSDHASFASKMNRDVYGANASGDGIADRIGRRAHFREGAGGGGFRRH